MIYLQVRKLSSRKFKQLTGVKRKIFQVMVRLVKAQEKLKKKPGCPNNLIVENQILLTIQYWREYRNYYHISNDSNIHESNVCRAVKK